eukprot:CAMPEP_0198461596 /NCGR_PEP_ID=MMETSP1456-20131121/305_1 /TAXON_ID=1461544 ORGANISM="Unidentified sp., Strain RCC1871" /NCGR_SAMPLE_ID=MMETSP1456 /ASSEMBLY_ACC=CAM_ASM_001119 /LENGTH=96 /DNA_ID=CAMNT_0044186643 /DNA_START=422 /DNA_END=709 /DNA_ORIENTATION=+
MTKACCFCLGFIASRSCLRMSLSLDMLMVRTKSSAGFTSPSPTICPSSSSSSLVDDSGTFLNVTPLPDIAAMRVLWVSGSRFAVPGLEPGLRSLPP